VMSYTCLPRTVAWSKTPADVRTLDPNRFRTGATRNSSRVLDAGVAFDVAAPDVLFSDINRSP
jgi:hypothetical protein